MLEEIKRFIKEKPEILFNYLLVLAVAVMIFVFAVRMMEINVFADEPHQIHYMQSQHLLGIDINQMENAGIRRDLNAQIQMAKMHNPEQYTRASFNALMGLLMSSITTVINPSTHSIELHWNFNELRRAREGLVPIPTIKNCANRRLLYSDIKELGSRDRYRYTGETWNSVSVQVRMATQDINNPNLTGGQVSTRRGQLLDAVGRLERLPESPKDWLYPLIMETAEAKLSSMIWLVALGAFGLGISVMTIFSILWSRCR